MSRVRGHWSVLPTLCASLPAAASDFSSLGDVVALVTVVPILAIINWIVLSGAKGGRAIVISILFTFLWIAIGVWSFYGPQGKLHVTTYLVMGSATNFVVMNLWKIATTRKSEESNR